MNMSPKICLVLLGLVVLCYTVDGSPSGLGRGESDSSSYEDGTLTRARSGSIFRRKKRETEPTPDSSESAHLSSAEVQNLLKFFMAAAWDSNKSELLAEFLDEFADSDTNITVVGWKEIRNPNGDLKEVRTVEFVIPPKPDTDDNIGNFEDDDDDDDEEEDEDRLVPWKELNGLKEIFAPFSLLGVPASISYESYEKSGKEEGVLYLTSNEFFVRAEGFAIYNKTTRASPEEVEKFISTVHGLGTTSVLKYDADGELQPGSIISPLLLGGVVDSYEASDDILLGAPEIIAETSQRYRQAEIPKQLAAAFNKQWPEYQWRVLVNPENFYISRDVSVTVTYDNLDLYEDSDVSYLVYGKKKEE